MSWFSGLEHVCRENVPLAEFTWYGLGGPARWFFTPQDEAELGLLLRRCAEHGVTWRLLGHGANLLVRDAGFDGAVIRLSGENWVRIHIDGPSVFAASGVDFPKLVKTTVDAGLAGLENLAGIPGTLGGIIRMNAGGKWGSIGQFVRTVRLMQPTGAVEERTNEQMEFQYRHSGVGGAVVLDAWFALERGDRAAIVERFRQVWTEKHAAQPAVSLRSCGCIFKNPPGQSAGALIDQAGLKGERRGGAEISPRHANFIVAHAEARAADVLELIELAQTRVRARFGVELQTEVEIW